MTGSKVGDRIELEIEDIAAGGEGVGKIDGFVFFVPAAAPGDRVEIELLALKKKYGRGRIVRILTPSPRRVAPPCPYYDACGGCQFQHLDYASQQHFKTKMVRDAVQHIGSLEGVEVLPCLAMESPWSYRNKAQMMVAGVASKPYFGFYAQRTHRVVPIDECLIQSDENNHLLREARDAVERIGWEPFQEATGKGLLRYAIARTTQRGESMLILVASRPDLPRLKAFLADLCPRVPHLKGVMLNLNSQSTNVILGPTTRVLWGQDHLVEEIEGLKFRISPASFFQVNPWGLRTIYRSLDQAISALDSDDSVLDLYCGVGSMALHLATRARRVVGIDSCAPAIEDAIANAELNELTNTSFFAGATEKVLPRLYQQGERFAAAVLDPPRKGCAPEVLNTVHIMRIPKLVYVSCNPATLARDLGMLHELGYQTESIQPIDMFPQTYHVESVAVLTRVGP